MTTIKEGLMFRNPNYKEDVLKAAQENHIWLNALAVQDPKEIGNIIIKWLNDNKYLINQEIALLPDRKELIIRINQS